MPRRVIPVAARAYAVIYKWTIFWIVLVACLSLITWRDSHNTTVAFRQLKGGLCAIAHGSSKASAANRTLFQATAHRARLRAKADRQAGLDLQAQADLDTARLYERFARESRPLTLPGC